MYRRIPDREELQAGAARLVAEDELSDTEIAQRCGITRRTLMRWKKQPTIQREIDENLGLIELHSEVRMLSERQKRIADMDIRFQELQGIVRQRAKSSEMRGVPGGSTGLMRRRKGSFRRRHGRTGLDPVCDYELDITLLREERRLIAKVAKALGQWQRPKYKPIAVPTSTAVPSGKQHWAALLIADGTRSDLEIAATCGINRRTLARWKEQPSFRTRVAEVRTTIFR
jgi:DNA-binding CsgD family transcriptional regulator